MSRHHDTIAALATPDGTAALAVLRVSGPESAALATSLVGKQPPTRIATHVDYRGKTGEVIDDVLVTFFKGPRSYTGEDALEVSCHGNPFIARKILDDLLTRGCRPAEPGEFTQRAFLNGRMDLSQAEAVMDIIHARSERALAAANAQLRGSLGRRMDLLIGSLLGVLAQIEAHIDFPEEDLPPERRDGINEEIDRIILLCNELIATTRYGKLLRDGIKTVILGAPNAGKSSLLNALVGRERALVSAEPGTTRDFIEERLIIGSHCVRLIDTAGLNPSPAPLERLGIVKTLERADEADLTLLVIDRSQATAPQMPADMYTKLRPHTTLLVFNKSDLSPALADIELLPGFDRAHVSALTGAGLDKLRQAIDTKVDALRGHQQDEIAINARHARALVLARDGLRTAAAKLLENGPTELIASDLREALGAFGEIAGRVDNERMLDRLFATFCIGK
jgi:tRNA modification GTPase